MISVAASTSLDNRAGYSNVGEKIAVCAPGGGGDGWGLTTSDVTGRSGDDDGDYAHTFFGTSAATPLVAGIAALLLAIKPSLSALQVKDILQRNARAIHDLIGQPAGSHSRFVGFGCVDASPPSKRCCERKGVWLAKAVAAV